MLRRHRALPRRRLHAAAQPAATQPTAQPAATQPTAAVAVAAASAAEPAAAQPAATQPTAAVAVAAVALAAAPIAKPAAAVAAVAAAAAPAAAGVPRRAVLVGGRRAARLAQCVRSGASRHAAVRRQLAVHLDKCNGWSAPARRAVVRLAPGAVRRIAGRPPLRAHALHCGRDV